jgi:oligopeptide/dipeptide ABC transporter ATP-binding protein
MIVHMPALDRRQRRDRMLDLLAQVGLDRAAASRYPHEFSGGQRQRIGIARALAAEPELVVADEPVSALDVSIQAQVLNLMRDLRERHGLSYLFIAHDLAVVRHMSQRVAVIYFGKIVEVAPVRELFASPVHPYTRMLLRSVPRVHVGARASSETDASFGEIPSAIRPPSGCAFHDRCKYRTPHCAEAAPALREIAPAHHAACHVA